MRRMHDVRSLLLLAVVVALPGCCGHRPSHRPLAVLFATRPIRPTVRLMQPIPRHSTAAAEQPVPEPIVQKQPNPIDQSPVYSPSEIDLPPVVEQLPPAESAETVLPPAVAEVPVNPPDVDVESVLREPIIVETEGPPPTVPMDVAESSEDKLPTRVAPETEAVIDVTEVPSIADIPEVKELPFGATSTESSSVLPEPEPMNVAPDSDQETSSDKFDLPASDLPEPSRGNKSGIQSDFDLPGSLDDSEKRNVGVNETDSTAAEEGLLEFPAFDLPDSTSTDSGSHPESGVKLQSAPTKNRSGIHHGTMMLWKSGYGPRRIDGPEGQLPGIELKRSGKAHIDDEGRLQVSEGAYVVEGLDVELLELAKDSSELTVELVFSPAHMKPKALALIASFSSSHESRNFSLGQQGSDLVFQLRTSDTGMNGLEPPLKIAKLPQEIPVHIVVSYRSGRLICLVNGVEMFKSSDFTGDFSNWEPHNLIMGDEWNHDADWNGSIEQIQIQTRALNRARARTLFKVWSESR